MCDKQVIFKNNCSFVLDFGGCKVIIAQKCLETNAISADTLNT